MSYMDSMRKAINISNYKLQLMPPDDLIVDEKRFASRFVLDALKELNSVSHEIEQELVEIEEVNIKTLIFINLHVNIDF